MKRLIEYAFSTNNFKDGMNYFFEYLAGTHKVDLLKLYLLSGDQIFFIPQFIYGNKINLGSLSINEKESLVVSSYLKNQDNWISDTSDSRHKANPFLLKQKVQSLLILPFLNQAVITIEFLRKDPVMNLERLKLDAKAYVTILLNRFYYADIIKDEINKAKENIEKHLTFSHKLSYVGQLASSLVHEIKNPLTTINLLINNLIECISSESNLTYNKDLLVIQEEIERISRLLSDFLNFAKPQKPRFEKILLSELAAKIRTIVSPHLKTKGIILETNFKDETEIEADKDQVQQIFLNLVLNAMEVLKKENSKIIISGSKKVKKGQKYYNVLIEDNGPGISNEILNKIFEPFFSESGKGTGLGLSIVHRLVENHEGFIEAYNLLSGGACFSIYFPV
jgi:signal transduction histidine kinase